MILILNFFSGLISFLICLVMQSKLPDEYSMIVFLPLIYIAFSSLLILVNEKKRTKATRITVFVLIFLEWIRCVFIPAIGVTSGYYTNTMSGVSSRGINTAILLVIYELIIVMTFAAIYVHFFVKCDNNNKSNRNSVMQLSGNNKIYGIFIFLSFAMMIFTRNIPFQFLALKTGTKTRLVLQGNDNLISDTIILYGLTFLVIVIVSAMYKKYLETSREIYLNIALITIILRMSLISSESRLALIYQAGAALLLLTKLFEDKRKKIIRVLSIAGIIVIGLLTIYKVFYAFMYSSYFEAFKIGKSSFGLYELSSQLDSYFYGIQTIGRNITYIQMENNANFSGWIMDFLRNTFGIHYFVRGNTVTTIEAYNLYLYGGRASSGYLFSSIGYGFMYYSFIFAPLATVINFVLACWFEKIVNRQKYLDIYYILCLTYVRFVVSQFAFFGGTWNYVSRTIVIGLLVVGIASIGRIRNNHITVE